MIKAFVMGHIGKPVFQKLQFSIKITAQGFNSCKRKHKYCNTVPIVV